MAWNPNGRWKGEAEYVWEVVRRLFSLHVVLDFLDRGGGEFVFLHVCFFGYLMCGAPANGSGGCGGVPGGSSSPVPVMVVVWGRF